MHIENNRQRFVQLKDQTFAEQTGLDARQIQVRVYYDQLTGETFQFRRDAPLYRVACPPRGLETPSYGSWQHLS